MLKTNMMVAGMAIEVWRKPIKNFNMAISDPAGQVRISVPLCTSDDRIRLVILERMAWIQKHQRRLQARPQSVILRAENGEMHSLWGKQYSLHVVERSLRHHVHFEPSTGIFLHVRAGTSTKNRLRLLTEWYRGELKSRIPHLLEFWQPRVGRKVNEFRIKRMKTRWGTCNITSRRLWLNLELAKKPAECLEYILVHELVHLLERGHTAKFYAHMDHLLPNWRHIDTRLNT